MIYLTGGNALRVSVSVFAFKAKYQNQSKLSVERKVKDWTLLRLICVLLMGKTI